MLVSFSSQAYSEAFIPSQKKLDLISKVEKFQLTWNVDFVSMDFTYGLVNEAPVALITIPDAIEKRGNTFMVPNAAINLETKLLTNPNFGWVSVNCNNSNVKNFGAIVNRAFTQIPPENVYESSPWYDLTRYLCGNEFENEIYYGYGSSNVNNNFLRYAFTANELYKQNNFRNIKTIGLTTNNMNKISGYTHKGEIRIDCKNESLVDSFQDNKTLFLSDNPGYYFLIKRVCDPSVPYYIGDTFLTSKKQINENPIKKDNIEKFKKECEELGFTPNTESFGECVLELM